MRFRDSMQAPDPSPAEHTHREVGDAGVGVRTEPALDLGLGPQRSHVTDVAGVTLLEQALVVRGVLGVPERPVRPAARAVDFVVAAQCDGDAGDDARARLRGLARGFGDAGDDVVADRALVRHPEDGAVGELARDAQHHRCQRGDDRGWKRCR